MRIPTSVIVMSLLTAAPFGLAIRDTLNGKKPGRQDPEEYQTRREREAMEAYEAELKREAEEQEAKRVANFKRLDTLFGREPGSMGSYFDGMALGTTIDEPFQERMMKMQSDALMVPFGDGGQTVTSFGAVIFDYSDDGTCEKLEEKLTLAWGPATYKTWLDTKTGQRATLETEPCKLTFSKFLDANAWVAAAPLDFVGLAAEKARAKLDGVADSIEAYDDSLEWNSTGTGYGVGGTSQTATIENGKVTGVYIRTETDFDTFVAIRDALSARLKAQPTRDEDTGAYVWKKKPGFMLQQDASTHRFTLVVGKNPYP